MKELTIKKSNPIIEKAAELREQGRAELMNLESFTSALNRKPAVVKVNKFAKNSEYVPIGHIQTMLDQMFFGLWQTKNFKKDVIANELVGSIELWVFHPVVKEWIVRTGVAATQIRQEKNAKLTDIDKKIKNALEQDAPHLYADCLKSAAKTLGPAFGRDLNRDFVDNYKALVSNHVQANVYNAKEVKETLNSLNNINDVFEYWETQPLWQQDPKIVALFEERKRDLNDEQF
jgi:hypothetical protein